MMKNLQKLFSMAVLVCMVATLFSCSKDEEESIDVEAGIVGSWEIESSEVTVNGQSLDTYIGSLAGQLGMSAEEFQESFGDQLSFDFEGNFDFDEGKKFTGKVEDDAFAGTWSVVDKMLILKHDDGETAEYTVISLTSTKGVISTQYTDSSMQGTPAEMDVVLYIKKK